MTNQPALNPNKQQIINFYNARTNYDSDLTYRRAMRLVELAKLQPGQTILDVATGTGFVAIASAEIVGDQGKVIGVDLATVLLEQAQQKITAAGLNNIELIEADADNLDFPANSFDAILCSSAIVLFSDIPGVLSSWYRCLKPGGLVAFSTYDEVGCFPNPIVIKACAKTCNVVVPNLLEPFGTPEKCQNLLQAAGFAEIEVKIEEFGHYISLESATKLWGGEWMHPHGHPLTELSSEEIEKCKAEYVKEIESLATDKGVWRGMKIFFVFARKPREIDT